MVEKMQMSPMMVDRVKMEELVVLRRDETKSEVEEAGCGAGHDMLQRKRTTM